MFQPNDVLRLTKQHLEVTGWRPTQHNGTVVAVDGSRVFYDKEHPRAEIYIYEYRKEEDNAAGNENLHR